MKIGAEDGDHHHPSQKMWEEKDLSGSEFHITGHVFLT